MKNLTSLLFLMAFLCYVSISAQDKKQTKVSKKPNIIYILADDLGIGDVSCYGSDKNKTPNNI